MVSPTTQAALEAEILHWRALVYADFVGDTLRATNNIIDKTVSGSGDPELNGTYESFTNNIIDISPVQHNETGSDTVSIQMSGLIVNSDFLNLIGDKAKWQGRPARLWFFVSNDAGGQIGDIVPYYTGYMNDISISGGPSEQTVTLTIENYLTSLSVAANRTYMMQKLYDAGDLSANATLGAANGMGESSGVTGLIPGSYDFSGAYGRGAGSER